MTSSIWDWVRTSSQMPPFGKSGPNFAEFSRDRQIFRRCSWLSGISPRLCPRGRSALNSGRHPLSTVVHCRLRPAVHRRTNSGFNLAALATATTPTAELLPSLPPPEVGHLPLRSIPPFADALRYRRGRRRGRRTSRHGGQPPKRRTDALPAPANEPRPAPPGAGRRMFGSEFGLPGDLLQRHPRPREVPVQQ